MRARSCAHRSCRRRGLGGGDTRASERVSERASKRERTRDRNARTEVRCQGKESEFPFSRRSLEGLGEPEVITIGFLAAKTPLLPRLNENLRTVAGVAYIQVTIHHG